MSEQNKSCITEIESINKEIERMAIDYKDKVQEYELKKKHFQERVVKVYQEAQLNKVRIE